MTSQRLILHPGDVCASVQRMDVGFVRVGAGLGLRYVLRGDVAKLRIAPPAAPDRTDELWKTTCFEAFIAKPEGGYCEFNFSPSSRWAAYEFESYRDGMRKLAIPAPKIEPTSRIGEFALDILLDLRGNAEPDATWRCAISAVIEETSGAKSYWALAHPPGKPDFHHPDGFALELPKE